VPLVICIEINFLNTIVKLRSLIFGNMKNNTNKYVIKYRTNARAKTDTDARGMSRPQVVFLNLHILPLKSLDVTFF